MPAFATIDDVEADWRSLSTEEKQRAEHLLNRATTIMVAEFPGLRERIAAERIDPDLASLVCADMVKQAMLGPIDQPAATSIQQANGPFNKSVTLAQQIGSLYVTKKHRRWLGYSGPTVGQINPLAHLGDDQ